jgi:hypothetical protein
MESLVVRKDGFVEDEDGTVVGQLVEGDPKKLRGRAVDEDGEITDKYGNVKGRAEPYEPEEEEEPEEADLSILEGKVVNKNGNVVDPATGAVFGRIVEGDKRLAGRKVDGKGQIWGDNGQIVGRAELIPGAEQHKAEGPFFGFDNAQVAKDGVVMDGDRIIGRLIEGDAKRLLGRKVDEDGDVLDKNGNSIGKAERWEPEEKQRDVNPMAGRKVTKEGEVRDADGNLIGKLTSGNLATLVGKKIDDNGFVVDNDGNKLGECTLLEHIPEPEPEEEEGPTAEELEVQAKAEQDRQLAEKMCNILRQTLDQVKPVCKQIAEVRKPIFGFLYFDLIQLTIFFYSNSRRPIEPPRTSLTKRSSFKLSSLLLSKLVTSSKNATVQSGLLTPMVVSLLLRRLVPLLAMLLQRNTSSLICSRS